MSRIFSFANYFMALLFVFAAIMQYNDPDSIRWIALYASSALACVYWIFGIYQRWVCGVIGVVCLVWFLILVVDVSSLSVNGADLINSLEMKNESIEQYREIGGLIIVALWMSILFFKRNPETNSS